MKIAFKNFLTTLRRYKTASALNIAGLTMAFTAFYVMMAQVTYDLGYDRSFPESDRLYTVVPISTAIRMSSTRLPICSLRSSSSAPKSSSAAG